MSRLIKPLGIPKIPNFSSGPCAKRPGWNTNILKNAVLGRSHRSQLAKEKIKEIIGTTKNVLQIPDNYKIGLVPASDTGAIEMMMWSMLGPRPVDVCFWDSFGEDWYKDISNQLKLPLVNIHSSSYGSLPDLTKTNPNNDIIFTFNGTTSGVRVPNLDWISDNRTGLTFNDATSATFAMNIDWSKVDVSTFSWQKALGGEGGHGMCVLSPRAIERIKTFKPKNRPIPKIFQLTKNNDVNLKLFDGETINTPSMLCIEDYLDVLNWAKSIGGLSELISRSEDNFRVIRNWVEITPWVHFLAEKPDICSNTSVCLTLDTSAEHVKKMCDYLEDNNIAFDINSYRNKYVGLRIWCGATVETKDIELLLPWIEYAYYKYN